MKIYIKNMVAQGTRKFVLMELKKLGLRLISFESGELEFQDDLSDHETAALEKSLGKYGLEIERNYVPESHYTLYNQDNSLQYDEDMIGEGMLEMAELSNPR